MKTLKSNRFTSLDITYNLPSRLDHTTMIFDDNTDLNLANQY